MNKLIVLLVMALTVVMGASVQAGSYINSPAIISANDSGGNDGEKGGEGGGGNGGGGFGSDSDPSSL